VFLEGPQGGIWYWCVVGFAVALTEEQRLLYARQRMQFIKPEHAYAQG